MPKISPERIQELIDTADKQRGYVVPPLVKEVFLERLAYKDRTAYLIGKAFCSMYRTGIKVELDLTDVCNLDAEGKHLLFQAIFARDVPGWSCDYYCEIEQEIKELLNLTYITDRVIINA